jgi:predicted XRE-type DNA-binding protein
MCNEIAVIVDERGLTQARVAEIAGLAQADVSRIVNANVKDYSVWRLMRVLNDLGKNILVEFSDAGGEPGRVSLAFPETDTESASATPL